MILLSEADATSDDVLAPAAGFTAEMLRKSSFGRFVALDDEPVLKFNAFFTYTRVIK